MLQRTPATGRAHSVNHVGGPWPGPLSFVVRRRRALVVQVALPMKLEFSKRVRTLLRQLAAMAYERELRVLLDELEESFARWRRGEINSLSLTEVVDRFARGPVKRRLDQRYKTASILHMNVAGAIVSGILRASEVPSEVLDALAQPIDFYRQGLADGTISFDEEPD